MDDDVIPLNEIGKIETVKVYNQFYVNKQQKRIAELEEKISILLSCKNCPDNKGGLLCQKEYEDKCLAQKIQYIKELKEEIKNNEDLATVAYMQGAERYKPKWHKVSEQIPTEEKDYLVKLTDGTIDVMAIALDGNLEPYLLTPKFDFYKDVEKWCEIPKED